MSKMNLHDDSLISWSARPVSTEINDEIVLMNIDLDRCYGLGSMGSLIWRKLAVPVTFAELYASFDSTYEGSPGEIRSDLIETLSQLAREGLIEVKQTRKLGPIDDDDLGA